MTGMEGEEGNWGRVLINDKIINKLISTTKANKSSMIF